MSLSALLLLACGTAAAQDDVLELKTENLPYVVRLPRSPEGAVVGWTHALTPEPEVAISLLRLEPAPLVVMYADIPESFQPDFARADGTKLQPFLEEAFDLASKDFGISAAAPPVDPAAPPVDPAAPPAPPPRLAIEYGTGAPQKHPALGDVMVVPVAVSQGPARLEGRIVLFPVEAGFGLVNAWAQDVASLDQGMTDALALISLTRPPVPADELPSGHYAAEAGYELDLPASWRALTARELTAAAPPTRLGEGPYAGKRAIEGFLDPAALKPTLRFTCQASTTEGRPLEVLDPTKSRIHETNYLTRARVMLKEGSVRIRSGGVEEIIKFELVDLDPVQVDPADAGALSLVSVSDREAYILRGQGTQREQPVQFATFYTAWDDVGLDCLAVAPAGAEGLLDTFEQTMKTLTVTDAPNHPMTLSFLSRYKRWWPYAHPAVQLYWLMIPLFLVALVPAIREWWETRR